MSLRDLIDDRVDVDSDDDAEASFDDDEEIDGGDSRRRANGKSRSRRRGSADGLDDSSEEEEDDDDEDAAREVREGFIVDEDEDEEERHKRKRKRRAHREVDEELDADDLDLIGENIGGADYERKEQSQSKFKRLKRGRDEDRGRTGSHALNEIFSDDEDIVERREPEKHRARHGGIGDEMDDFISDDELSDEEERQRAQEQAEVGKQGFTGALEELNGYDSDTRERLREVFGAGDDYEDFLRVEQDEADEERDAEVIELKDVFEPFELKENFLTDEDNIVRVTDEPERYQLARKAFADLVLSNQEMKYEARWIARKLNKSLDDQSHVPKLEVLIAKMLEFFLVDQVEVPFVIHHRFDYLTIPTYERAVYGPNGELISEAQTSSKQLLSQDDLWEILDLDLKYRAMIEKRNALRRTYNNLDDVFTLHNNMLEELLERTDDITELGDIQEFINFTYASELRDVAAQQTNGMKKPGTRIVNQKIFERIRSSKTYHVVRAFGISADDYAKKLVNPAAKKYTEDPAAAPLDLAGSDEILGGTHNDPEKVLDDARQMFAEEIFMNPNFRKYVRDRYSEDGVLDCLRTEKGLKTVDESHPFYRFKYLRELHLADALEDPVLILNMLQAEADGLINIKISLQYEHRFVSDLEAEIKSDNLSAIADAWNDERTKALQRALIKTEALVIKQLKETLRGQSQVKLAKLCQKSLANRLDQAAFRPPGLRAGEIPHVLALSAGEGRYGKDAICYVFAEANGRIPENGKFDNLRTDEASRAKLSDLHDRRRPDVIAVSGFTVTTRRLFSDVRGAVDDLKLQGPSSEDDDEDEDGPNRLDVIMVNDEVARLYMKSDRAEKENPGMPPLTRYCVALARYVQNPLKEYIALGDDILSISLHSQQQLLPQDMLLKYLEMTMVDYVNLYGVNINDAMVDSYTSNLLPYVCGLGPRKAGVVTKAIAANGGSVQTRAELVGDADADKIQVVGANVFFNCASFLYIVYEDTVDTQESEYLDGTRVHPEDYELARKMAADALELDEEDQQAEIDLNGRGAVVKRLVKEENVDKVEDLILEEYAEQIEQSLNQRKKATLNTIKDELQYPYRERRGRFHDLSTPQIFTLLTGETEETLASGNIVAVSIAKIDSGRHENRLFVKLDCGVEGRIPIGDSYGSAPTDLSMYRIGQTLQAKIMSLDMVNFSVELTINPDEINRPSYKNRNNRYFHWDSSAEDKDRTSMQKSSKEATRTQRVVKHPLFRPFNAMQAEEFLGSQSRGDAVVRPSSKGMDHLAVTWKVADGMYQHLDVLEMDKENEYALGKILRVGSSSRHTYSDLDELIVSHVKAMSKKVEEMMNNDKYRNLSKADTDKWLETYSQANPKKSVYAFCLNPKYPGYFFLCFKAGLHAKLGAWPVKIVPNAFELQGNAYPDMRALCNGFKLLFANMQNGRR